MTIVEVIVLCTYMFCMLYLGYNGKQESKSAVSYSIANKNNNSILLLLSYIATIISTSAIIGFGGLGAWLGTSIWWLIPVSILSGIIIPFYILGKPIYLLTKKLKAKTYSELVGLRYNSDIIRKTSSLIIVLIMPIYTAGILIGCGEIISSYYNIPANTGIVIIFTLTLVYVLYGGLKAVILTDTLQSFIMIFSIMIVTGLTIYYIGGLGNIIDKLNNVWDVTTSNGYGALTNVAVKMGFINLTSMPTTLSEGWLFLVTGILMSVLLGAIALPHLVVRIMVFKNENEVRRVVPLGIIVMLLTVCSIYFISPLINIWYFNNYNMTAAQYIGSVDKIIPSFIVSAMPKEVSFIFLFGMIAAAMSTLSGQFHTMGVSLVNDVFNIQNKLLITRICVGATAILSLYLALTFSGKSFIIARSTIIFFTLFANTFLPLFIFGLFWDKSNKIAALTSMFSGLFLTLFWFIFINKQMATSIGLCKYLFGSDTLINNKLIYVDSLTVLVPLGMLIHFITIKLTYKNDIQ